MSKKWIAVNLALVVVAGLLAWWLVASAARFNAENDLSKLQPARGIKQQISLEGGLPPLRQRQGYRPEEFEVIPAQNLFAESRTMQKEAETAVVEEAPKLTARPVLVGVAISGNQRLASVIDSSPQMNVQGASRRARTKRLGDVIQGYTIVDITEDQMVLAYGNQREIIPLYDTTKQRPQGGKTPIVATRVVNFGPGGGGTGARVAAAQGGAPGTPGSTVVTSVGSPASVSSSPSVVTVDRPGAQTTAGQQTATGRTTSQPVRPSPGLASPQQQAPAAWNERTDEQGRRIIRTPFGDIIRDKPPNNP